MWKGARSRARRSGVEFSIEIEDIDIPLYCPVFGMLLVFNEGGIKDNSPTLDRVFNDLGYVKGNVVVVSWRANRLKSNADPLELVQLAEYYGKKERVKAPTKNTKSLKERSRRQVV